MTRIDTQQLAASYGQFKEEVTIALDAIGNQLDAGAYAEAAAGLNVLSQRVAKTNVAVRTVLIRGGFIDTE
jgi:hypothetical protein